jgi:hypothetical protein
MNWQPKSHRNAITAAFMVGMAAGFVYALAREVRHSTPERRARRWLSKHTTAKQTWENIRERP